MFAIGLFLYALIYILIQLTPVDEEGFINIPSWFIFVSRIGMMLMLLSVLEITWRYMP